MLRLRAPNRARTLMTAWGSHGGSMAPAPNTYAFPDRLVDTAWVDAHKTESTVKIVEVDVDTGSYDEGHVPGAIGWNWSTQLCDTATRDILSKAQLEALMQNSGIANGDTVILY